tara:strand:+ start:129 stop:386 length:258 start_codon:yes stop_codon:yes gene_type:complete
MTSKDFFEEAKYEWCASEQQDKPLLNDMMKFAKLYHTEQLILSGVSQQSELLSDLIDFSNNNAPPIIQKGLKQVILEFNQSLNCG